MNYETRFWRNKDWLWTADDHHAWKHLTIQHPDIPKQILEEITDVNVVVQAGGHCGLYTSQYCSVADEVVTFEPDAWNLKCLKENLKEYNNVTIFPYALGNEDAECRIVRDRVNSGATIVKQETCMNNYNITQVKLDNYHLEPDLIHLDIEGSERNALQGMIETIKQYKPAIALERANGEDILLDIGYKKHKQFGLDWLYL